MIMPRSLYFNPRSPHGERQDLDDNVICISHFNPRSPHGERPSIAYTGMDQKTFQSTLPARGATGTTSARHIAYIFQSTLPARGATVRPSGRRIPACHFNPRSPHGERRISKESARKFMRISIHAPRTGSDGSSVSLARIAFDFNPRSPHGERRFHSIQAPSLDLFQSTLPARGATRTEACAALPSEFQSTLPARGATTTAGRAFTRQRDFNPRSPHGERPVMMDEGLIPEISIHAPRTGSDRVPALIWKPCDNFNPRSPHGERRAAALDLKAVTPISIHAPRTGSDRKPPEPRRA